MAGRAKAERPEACEPPAFRLLLPLWDSGRGLAPVLAGALRRRTTFRARRELLAQQIALYRASRFSILPAFVHPLGVGRKPGQIDTAGGRQRRQRAGDLPREGRREDRGQFLHGYPDPGDQRRRAYPKDLQRYGGERISLARLMCEARRSRARCAPPLRRRVGAPVARLRCGLTFLASSISFLGRFASDSLFLLLCGQVLEVHSRYFFWVSFHRLRFGSIAPMRETASSRLMPVAFMR